MAKNVFSESPIDTFTRDLKGSTYELPDLSEIRKPKQPSKPDAGTLDVDYNPEDLKPPEDLRPLFDAAAEEYGVPANVLQALAQQESSYRTDAIGVETPWGRAKGVMQYIDPTADSLGINPFDPAQAIGAAARQLRDRLARGYTMREAIMAHHGGDNRDQWGPKTNKYGDQVLRKAGTLGNDPNSYIGDKPPAMLAREGTGFDPKSRPIRSADEMAEGYMRGTGIGEKEEPTYVAPGWSVTGKDAKGDKLPDYELKLRRVREKPETATPEDYDTFTEATKKELQNVPENMIGATGGLIQLFGDQLSDERERHFQINGPKFGLTPEEYKLVFWAESNGLLTDEIKSGRDIKMAVEVLKDQLTAIPDERIQKFIVDAGLVNPERIAGFGEYIRSEQEAQKVKVNAEPGSMAYYGSQAIRSIAENVPALAMSVATRNPTYALGDIGVRSAGQSYGEGRDKGLSPEKAREYATTMALAEIIPSTIPVGRFIKPGSGMLKDILGDTVAEGGQEAVTAALQAGIDQNFIDPDMSLKDALVRIAEGALIGTMAGAGMSGTIRTGEKVAYEAQGGAKGERGRALAAELERGNEGEFVDNLDETTARTMEPVEGQARGQATQGRQTAEGEVVQPGPMPLDGRLTERPDQQAPEGPLGRATVDAAREAELETVKGDPVEVRTQTGVINGVVSSYEEDGLGNFNARILDTDTGELYQFTQDDGVEINRLVRTKEEEPQTEPAKPRQLEDMNEGELRDRLKVLTQQGRQQGWTPKLLEERKRVEGFIDQMNESRQQDAELDRMADEMAGMPEEAPLPGEAPQEMPVPVEQERRQDIEERRRVADMSPDEMRKALLEDDLTGLGNRRAYAENPRKPVQVSVDADSLKWVNDNMSHGAGDQMLQAIGRAFKKVNADAYHPSGDEFWMQADTQEEADALMKQVSDELAGAIIEFETPDGEIITKRGIGLSYGTADTIDAAEPGLQAQKAERERTGQRAGRGETPPGVTRTGGNARVSGDTAEGDQNQEGDSAKRQERVTKQDKARQRIDEGRAWFGSEEKAQNFIAKNDLGDEFTVDFTGKRYEVVPKAPEQESDDGLREEAQRQGQGRQVAPDTEGAEVASIKDFRTLQSRVNNLNREIDSGRRDIKAAYVRRAIDASTLSDEQKTELRAQIPPEGRQLRSDGTPFASEAKAKNAMKNRRLDGYEIVPVEGGFALDPATEVEQGETEEAPTQEAAPEERGTEEPQVSQPETREAKREKAKAQRVRRTEKALGASQGDEVMEQYSGSQTRYRVESIDDKGVAELKNVETGATAMLSADEIIANKRDGSTFTKIEPDNNELSVREEKPMEGMPNARPVRVYEGANIVVEANVSRPRNGEGEVLQFHSMRQWNMEPQDNSEFLSVYAIQDTDQPAKALQKAVDFAKENNLAAVLYSNDLPTQRDVGVPEERLEQMGFERSPTRPDEYALVLPDAVQFERPDGRTIAVNAGQLYGTITPSQELVSQLTGEERSADDRPSFAFGPQSKAMYDGDRKGQGQALKKARSLEAETGQPFAIIGVGRQEGLALPEGYVVVPSLRSKAAMEELFDRTFNTQQMDTPPKDTRIAEIVGNLNEDDSLSGNNDALSQQEQSAKKRLGAITKKAKDLGFTDRDIKRSFIYNNNNRWHRTSAERMEDEIKFIQQMIDEGKDQQQAAREAQDTPRRIPEGTPPDIVTLKGNRFWRDPMNRYTWYPENSDLVIYENRKTGDFSVFEFDTENELAKDYQPIELAYEIGLARYKKQNPEPEPTKAKKPKKARKPKAEPSIAEQSQSEEWGANNKLVTRERAEELRKRLKGKLGQLNSGIDPEILAVGTELAVYHIEAGARKFTQFAKAIAADLGAKPSRLRPYLRSWYNGARDMMEDNGLPIDGMDDADSVREAIQNLEALDNENESDQTGSADDERAAPGGDERPGVDSQRGTAQEDNPDLEAGEPGNVGQTAAGRGRQDVRGTAAAENVESDGEQPAGGDANDGRTGASGEGLSDAGAGSGQGAGRGRGSRNTSGQGSRGGRSSGTGRAEGSQDVTPEPRSPAALGPGNFHYDNPLEVVGGGQVARFNKNKAAIERYAELRDTGREPTKEDQQVIASYTGWGSFGQELFQGTYDRPRPKEGWEERSDWLRENLGKKEWEGVQRSIINAHYTDPPTVMAMWDMIRQMGFEGGRVLEPSMGIGNFFGMMPEELKTRSNLAGIELDPVTGGMAKILYPDANINVMGYEESKTPDNFYDVVIGNWPFANIKVPDRKYQKLNPNLHDYFFLKALDQTRPGGLVVGITTHGTMDKKGKAIRNELARKGELMGAFRLPTGAFQEYAGTKVVTDIVILRKRKEPLGMIPTDAGWLESVPYKTPSGEEVYVNEYFANNPQFVIGEIDFGSGTTTGRPGLIVNRPDNVADMLRAIPETLPADGYVKNDVNDRISYVTNHLSDREGSLVRTEDGELGVVRGEYIAKAQDIQKYAVKSEKTTKDREAQLDKLIAMRRAYGELVEAERSGTEKEATAARKELKKQYDQFVKDHKRLNESYGLKYMARIKDPFYPALAALERQGKKGFEPSDILTTSTMRGAKKIANPSISEAYVLARNTSVNPTLKEIAERAGKSEEEVRSELIEKGAIFELANGDIEASDIYLSGNVRKKLREAQQAVADGNANMIRNVEALERVKPADIPYFNIEAQMGATWVPKEYYEQFVAEQLGLNNSENIEAVYRAGRWRIKMPNSYNSKSEAQTGAGTENYPFTKLVNAAISNQTVIIKTPKDPIDGSQEVDTKKTQEVNGKIAEMRNKFNTWVWSEPERRSDLEAEYNETRNNYAIPRYDGSFMAMEGMALSLGNGPFDLRNHQQDAIWRALVTRKSLNAHEVGTGKTFTMGGIAVESRRYGLAKKPMILAHNANSKTVANEIQQMYPAAKVLYIDNLAPKEIATRMRQIANDDWDAIVVPHSLINSIGFREKTLMEMAQQDIDELMEEAYEAADEDGVTITEDMLGDPDEVAEELGKLRSPTAKELVKARNTIIANIKKQAMKSSKEGNVPFEELGIDMVLVDEVHEFKKPPLATRMRIKGMQTQSSNRSIALRFMLKYVRGQNNGGNVHTFSGTPITNSMTEAFHQMRYIMEEEMRDAGIDQWDGWFGSFAQEEMDIELNAAGEYEAVNRLSKFINTPELRRMIGQYMDVVFSDDMPEMQPRKTSTGKTLSDPNLTEAERSELLNGRTEGAKDRPYKQVLNETSDLTPEQQEHFETIQQWAREFRNMKGKERLQAIRSGDPRSPIVYEGLAAKVSFDARLMNGEQLAGMEGNVPDDPNSKASKTIKNILEIYRSDSRATQAVFTQLGLSKSATRTVNDGAGNRTLRSFKTFSTVYDMVERLVQAGIPREEIAVVTGSTSKDKRAQIAEAMNRSEIRVVFGSTQSLGVGVNMQKNMRALHHMDAPWMPGDLEQRNGRGQRQGNQWNTVREYRYLTDRIDGRRWQLLVKKQQFIEKFLKADDSVRVIDADGATDEDSDILESFAEAAGDARILQRAKVEKKIAAAQQLERLHSEGIASAKRKAKELGNVIENLQERIAGYEASNAEERVTKSLKANAGNDFKITIDGETFDDRQEAQTGLIQYMNANMKIGTEVREIGKYGDLTITMGQSKFASEPQMFVKFADGLEVQAGKPSVGSFEATLRGFGDALQKRREALAESIQSKARAEKVAQEPFQKAGELERLQNQLSDIEQDLQDNPIAPPAWLRSGAPVDTEIQWKGDTYTVTGHRWNDENWYVLVQDGDQQAEVPYMEAKDQQGFNLYEEREFVPAKVIEKKQEEGAEPESPQESADESRRENPNLRRRSLNDVRRDVLKRFTDPEQIMKGWKNAPKLNVAKEFSDLPEGLQEYVSSVGAMEDFTGAFWDGEMYVYAPNIESVKDLQRTILHEAIGHYGVFGFFGPQLEPALQEVFQRFRGTPEAKKVIKKYFSDEKFTASNKEHRVRVGAELLAHLAESGKHRSLWNKIHSLIRDALRRMGMTLQPSKADLYNILRSAERFVKNGEIAVRGKTDTFLSRPINEGDAPADREDVDPPNVDDMTPGERDQAGRKALAMAEKALKESQEPNVASGKVVGDMGIAANFLVHPRQVAVLHKQFTPAYITAINQFEMRDSIIDQLYGRYNPYMILPKESKEQVNKLLELGRIVGQTYDYTTAVTDGIPVPETIDRVIVTEQGEVYIAEEPIQLELSKPGDVIKLTPEQGQAYDQLRIMFDEALDLFKNQMLREFGLDQYVGEEDAAAAIMEEIDSNPMMPTSQIERLLQIAKTIEEIEQAKRRGYVPLSRHGDYVVTVKEKPEGMTSENYNGRKIIRGISSTYDPVLEALGATKTGDKEWTMSPQQYADFMDDAERVVYSTKIETGLRDAFSIRRLGKADGKVSEIPSVKKAIDEINKKYVAGNNDRRIIAFAPSKIDPENVSLQEIDNLANLAGVDNAQWDVIREQMENEIKGRSFRRHFFRSDNTPGYSTDFERNISQYISGMGGYLARRHYAGTWDDVLASIKGPRIHKYANDYRDYVNNPTEEFAMLRQVGFLSYIAGNFSTAVVNTTQVPVMTMPALTMISNAATASKEVARAYKDAVKMFRLNRKTGLQIFDVTAAPADVASELKEAWGEGAFVPLETYEVMATARARGVGQRQVRRKFEKSVQAIAYLFTAAERLNRLVTFIAAARIAKNPKHAGKIRDVLKNNQLAQATLLQDETLSPKRLGEFMIDETQYRMGKVNRPRVTRGVGSAIMQFKSFMLQSLEAWYRWMSVQGKEGKRAAAASLAMMVALGGLWGFPGGEELRGLIEAIYRKLTKEDKDLETDLRMWIAETSGQNWLAEFATKGAGYPLGVDLSRIGMGNIIPDSPTDVFGIPADMFIGRPERAFTKASQGQPLMAFAEFMPNFIKNPMQAYSWGRDGVRDGSGRLILLPEQVTPGMIAKKSIGFQPAAITSVRDYEWAQYREETAIYKKKTRILNSLAKAIAQSEMTNDPEQKLELEAKIDEIFEEVAEHNKNVESESRLIQITDRALENRIMREMQGVQATYGKERTAARTEAERMREVFGIDEIMSPQEEGQDE